MVFRVLKVYRVYKELRASRGLLVFKEIRVM
jgi:hypothetical protein